MTIATIGGGSKIVAGYVSFTEITDPREHRAYNAWHQLDHLPEQLTLPGVGWGERWVRSPACRAVGGPTTPPLDATDYLTLYLMAEPVDETMDQFKDLARTLADAGRFHRHRRSLHSQALSVLDQAVAGRAGVSAQAVPYRPNQGIHVRIDEVADPADLGEHSAGLLVDRLHRLASVPGVTGAWSFHEGSLPGAGPGRVLTVSWLEDDPTEVAGAIGCLPAPPSPAVVTVFDGVFEHIVPYQWDWFDTSLDPIPEEQS